MPLIPFVILVCLVPGGPPDAAVVLQAPAVMKRFDVAEFTLRVAEPRFKNAFTDVELTGEFTPDGGQTIRVQGFCDSQDGSIFRLRFCPKRYRIVRLESHATVRIVEA